MDDFPTQTSIYIYISKYMYKYIISYIYIYARSSVEGPHSQSHAVATLHAVGKINKGIREYQNPTPVKLYIQLGRSTRY